MINDDLYTFSLNGEQSVLGNQNEVNITEFCNEGGSL